MMSPSLDVTNKNTFLTGMELRTQHLAAEGDPVRMTVILALIAIAMKLPEIPIAIPICVIAIILNHAWQVSFWTSGPFMGSPALKLKESQ